MAKKGRGDGRVITEGRRIRERSSLEKAESPGLATDIENELETKVSVFWNKGRGPMTLDDDYLQIEDPFGGTYSSDYRAAKSDEVRQKILKNVAGAHFVDHWLGVRKAERERIVALREEAEREYVAKKEAGASGSVLEIAASSVVDLQKREDHLIAGTLRKQALGEVVISHALEIEDDRAGVVETVSRNLIIEPPFHPGVLEQLVLNNSALSQLVNAMEVNVDGTGWELVPTDTLKMEEEVEQSMDGVAPERIEELQLEKTRMREQAEKDFQDEVDRQAESLEGFFKEPWPGMSFTTLRRKLRRDKESAGNSYMEVLRNSSGDIVFARHIDHKLMRMVRLDDPVIVNKEIERGGEQVTVPMSLRERRFVEHVGGGALVPKFQQPAFAASAGADPNAAVTELDSRRLFSSQGIRIVYFKEFGASRDLDMWTGVWARDGEEIPMERRATEIIHETVWKSPRTPYGLPRWINNLPSVLGNRKAEEFNLAFFQAGGVPPLLITIAGGTMAERSAKALDERFNTRNPATKHQAVVMEVTGAGRMDKGQNKINVEVHRFGSERMQDALFGKYDEQTRSKIRESFRLPPVFVGDADSHNYNTVRSSYLVAEAQVFQPERDEEDEIVTMKLLRNMPNGERFRFRSLPLVIDDVDSQVKCIDIASRDSLVAPVQLVEALNKICNLELRFDQETNDKAREERMARVTAMSEGFARLQSQGGEEQKESDDGSDDSGEIQDAGAAKNLAKGEDTLMSRLDGLVVLGADLAEALIDGIGTAESRRNVKKNVDLYEDLSEQERGVVDRVMTMRGLGEDRKDLMELFGCSAAVIASAAQAVGPDLE